MIPERLKSHILNPDASVKDALDAINSLSGGRMILFVTDSDDKILGAVTDGDIRRALLRGVSISDSVCKAMNTLFTSLDSNDNAAEVVAEGKRRHLRLIPLTREGRLTDILDLDSLQAVLPVDAVLMAGGKGERLRPLTLHTPKPLLKVGGKPIIDRNIERLEAFGIKNVFVTVNYLGEQIEEHFSMRNSADPKPFAEVKCVREPRRLGTLGSLALVDGLQNDTVLVMNSDLLTNIDFDKMWRHHISTGAALTVGTVPYTVSVPYAIMRTDGTRILGLEEKPTYNYFANGGVYMMKRELIDAIPAGEYLDAPDFIESLIAKGERVESFAIEGRWIDIGSPDDFRAANELA
ncbi:MAG: nucleotidyltransferase family protein [Muribaculaceae bacterium]|nr:nucleotidyltransferase family protein [Muribaculaceae bacterium]